MKEERMKILEMLQTGVIDANEAEKLLAALEPIKKIEREMVINGGLSVGTKSKRKMLKIKVESTDGDNVDIQIPVEFANLLKSGKISNKIKIDEEDINIDEIIKMAEEGLEGDLINVETKDGEKIRIYID